VPQTPRYLRGYGLVEAPLSTCAARLDRASLGQRSVLRRRTGDGSGFFSQDATVGYLNHLTFPSTRWALFAVNDRWTAVLNNSRDGSEFADDASLVARVCATRTCRVVDHEPACILELHDEDGATVRSIHAALDGNRWDFGTHGDELPAEAAFDYTARRKRDRFTSDNLRTLLASLGVDPPVPAAFAATDQFVLLDEVLNSTRRAKEVAARACTAEQADAPGYGYLQRGLGYAKHMRTHAASVAFDLTRAVLLSPELEAQAKPHLAAARRRLGRVEFERLVRDVERLVLGEQDG